ncbi:MAG TPA: 16S rRNA (uracil(1498)-N(3))-methyltransferase [Firmicutes bacterium]|nr:16S rRNA (uracil(1498)-N(3))-methyltransferase [Bacillota bacterium]
MQRYFLNNDQFNEDIVQITGDDAHHISRVMRQSEGDEIIVCNEDKQSFIVKIIKVDAQVIVCQIVSTIEKNAELPVNVSIAQGIPKGDKFEWVIQKGTECGAFEFVPVSMERSVVKIDQKKEKKKLERWSKIAKEAAEQSHRSVVPTISEVQTFKQFIQYAKQFDICLFAYEETAKAGELFQLKQTLSQIHTGAKVLVLVGPEGGISEKEVTTLLESGFKACALGPRILRTETAPIYILSAISYELEL